MTNDPIYLLQSVFRFLDAAIDAHGDIFYMLLVYASIPLIAWILSGGLRRKRCRQNSGATISIIVIRPPTLPPPLPTIIGKSSGHGQRPSEEDDSSSFAA